MKYAAVLFACLAGIAAAAPVVNTVDYTFKETGDALKQHLDHITSDDLKAILGDKYGQDFDIAFKDSTGTIAGHITGKFYH